MAKNIHLFCATRLRGFILVTDGHAVLHTPERVIGAIGILCQATIGFVSHGSSVPISREGPPVLIE